MPKVGRERKTINPDLQTQISNTRKGTKKGTKTGTRKNVSTPQYWIEPISEMSTGSKAIYRLVSTEDLGKWVKAYEFPFPDNPEEYIVFQFKDDEYNKFDSNDVYNELSLQYQLSLKGFMPKIVLCIDNGPDNKNTTVYSFPDFIESLDPKKPRMPKDLKYIVEKLTCGSDILSTYAGNYSQYFSDIKGLFHRLADEEGIMLLDMKPEHLCKNKTGELCFIDADTKLIRKIDETEINNAVTYTLFQVYAFLNAQTPTIDIKHTGITSVEYTDMMKYIVGLQITRDCSKEYVAKHTPLERLIHYSKRASDSSTNIMSEIKEFYNPSALRRLCRNYAPSFESVFYCQRDWFETRGIIIGDFQ
jgi:hypothetical protein